MTPTLGLLADYVEMVQAIKNVLASSELDDGLKIRSIQVLIDSYQGDGVGA